MTDRTVAVSQSSPRKYTLILLQQLQTKLFLSHIMFRYSSQRDRQDKYINTFLFQIKLRFRGVDNSWSPICHTLVVPSNLDTRPQGGFVMVPRQKKRKKSCIITG